MSEFKYKIEHSELTCDCPPKDSFAPCKLVAYRWVHEDMEHENNFKPVLKINPSRIDEFETCEAICDSLGISLFNNEHKAEKKLKSFLERKPMLEDTLGNSIAVGELIESDGVGSKPNRTGHFTFHENEGSDIKSKFVFLKKVDVEK